MRELYYAIFLTLLLLFQLFIAGRNEFSLFLAAFVLTCWIATIRGLAIPPLFLVYGGFNLLLASIFFSARRGEPIEDVINLIITLNVMILLPLATGYMMAL
jgi:hypothetical protein